MALLKTSRKAESEKALEARLVSEVRKRGGIALKLTSQFHRGMPDRLLLLPYHTQCFVEMKSTGEKPTALQLAAHEQLRALKFSVRVVDNTESLEDLLATLDRRIREQEAAAAEISTRCREVRHEVLAKKNRTR